MFHDNGLASAGRGGKGRAFSSRPIPSRPNLWRSCRSPRVGLRVLAIAAAKGAKTDSTTPPVKVG